ncbi:acetyltransferase [Amnibacterium sp. CER49]|uniref:GNAT family N-acetyltransferase n=1 Tax=Amnibacterium sp. CER49 TaxID=3039161 RepID=UPI00244CACC2|nr:GNAT family N-acetyltransferase [Amnibacterium sp. CER49]MDH2445215.1 acetyltransferase [Amnibacterium sp. CER49]
MEILKAGDPRCAQLEREGWTVVGESWGARLRLRGEADLAPARSAVARATDAGIAVRELGRPDLPALAALDAATAPDYPVTPASFHEARSAAALGALLDAGRRAFGAFEQGQLLAATVARRDGERAETDFTCVRRDARRRGLAAAVKGAAVLALAREGARVFGTGGARGNAGSIRMNEALGYVLEERWLSYAPP